MVVNTEPKQFRTMRIVSLVVRYVANRHCLQVDKLEFTRYAIVLGPLRRTAPGDVSRDHQHAQQSSIHLPGTILAYKTVAVGHEGAASFLPSYTAILGSPVAH